MFQDQPPMGQPDTIEDGEDQGEEVEDGDESEKDLRKDLEKEKVIREDLEKDIEATEKDIKTRTATGILSSQIFAERYLARQFLKIWWL